MEENNIIKYLKLISGRVVLTLLCGIAFLIFTLKICSILEQKIPDITFENLNGMVNMIFLIISNIITFYFSKSTKSK